METLKPGYKRAEIGIIPEDWVIRSLEMLGEWKGGGTPSKSNSDFWKNGTIPWVTSGDMKTARLRNTTFNITDKAIRFSSTTYLDANAVLVVTRSGILRKYLPVALNAVPVTINQDIKAIIPYSGVSGEYLLHTLTFFGPDILKTCLKTGTTVESIEFTWLKRYQVPVPSLREQQTIAVALNEVDNEIAALDDLIAKKHEIKQGVMQRLLTREKRLPGFLNDWERKQIGEIAHIKRGASPRPIADPRWFGGTIGWVRISDVTSSRVYLTETSDYLSDLGVEQSVPIYPNELIMSIAATVGLFAISKIDACIHDGFVAFKNLHESVDVLFLYYYLTYFSNIFSEAGQTGSQKNVNSDIVGHMRIYLPNRSEQQAIVAILSDMDQEIATLEETRKKTCDLKQGMMQELLTGKTRLV